MHSSSVAHAPWRRLSVVLFAAGGILSCGGGSTSPKSFSLPAAPTLTLSSKNLNFGSVAVGSSRSSSIKLTNSSSAGTPNLVVTNAIVTGSAFELRSSAAAFTLEPGQSSSLTIVFTPSAGGNDSGQLALSVQGVSELTTISLSGVGVEGGQLSVSPAAINFGNIPVGASQEQTGSLAAAGSDVTISEGTVSGSGYSLSGIVFPVTVSAGTSVSFTVSFSPESSGTASGKISFVSDAATSPTVLSLTGTGSQPVQHSVQLSWKASTSQVLGYNIYRSTQLAGSYVRLNTSLVSNLGFTDYTVQSGATYYYAATSVDSNNLESAHSNIATATVP